MEEKTLVKVALCTAFAGIFVLTLLIRANEEEALLSGRLSLATVTGVVESTNPSGMDIRAQVPVFVYLKENRTFQEKERVRVTGTWSCDDGLVIWPERVQVER